MGDHLGGGGRCAKCTSDRFDLWVMELSITMAARAYIETRTL